MALICSKWRKVVNDGHKCWLSWKEIQEEFGQIKTSTTWKKWENRSIIQQWSHAIMSCWGEQTTSLSFNLQLQHTHIDHVTCFFHNQCKWHQRSIAMMRLLPPTKAATRVWSSNPVFAKMILWQLGKGAIFIKNYSELMDTTMLVDMDIVKYVRGEKTFCLVLWQHIITLTFVKWWNCSQR